MQGKKNERKKLIKEAEKLIKELEHDEAKITLKPNDEALLEALLKDKNTTQPNC